MYLPVTVSAGTGAGNDGNGISTSHAGNKQYRVEKNKQEQVDR